jgi:hypothetical protein
MLYQDLYATASATASARAARSAGPLAPATKLCAGPLLWPSADPSCHTHQAMTRGAPAPPLKPFSRRSCLLRRHLPTLSATMLDQRLCRLQRPGVQPAQRPGTPAGAGRAYLSRWRRGPGLSYRLGRVGHTLASPSTAVRWQTAAPGTRPTASDQKKAQE